MPSVPTYLIGVDDTDIPGSPGTGRVARGLARRIVDYGEGMSLGVTRHQLLVHPDIHYTSHNSSLCLEIASQIGVDALISTCRNYLRENRVEGADPGFCIGSRGQVGDGVVNFGWRAKREVLNMGFTLDLAQDGGLYLEGVGGSGEGVIGALAAVGLRESGDDGRFVDLRGARYLEGVVRVAQLKRLGAIDKVQDEEGQILADEEWVNTLGRVRPSLKGGEVVLWVRKVTAEGTSEWQPVEALEKIKLRR